MDAGGDWGRWGGVEGSWCYSLPELLGGVTAGLTFNDRADVSNVLIAG